MHQVLSSLIRKELENICRYPNEPFIVHVPNESISVCFIADDEVGFAGIVFEVHLNHVVYLIKCCVCYVLSISYISSFVKASVQLFRKFLQESFFAFFLDLLLTGGFILW